MFKNQLEACSTPQTSQAQSHQICECKQLRLRAAHLEADLLHLQQRKVHLEKENEAFAAADQAIKAKLAEALAENALLEALLAEKSSEERRKCTELEAQQADIASSLSELQSIFDQFTKMLAENELGSKMWRSAKSKHIAAQVRLHMDKHGHLDTSSALWDRAVRLRLGSDPQRSTPRTTTTLRPSPYTSTGQPQDRPKSQGSAHKHHGARRLESNLSHMSRDERESPRSRREARSSPSVPLSDCSTTQQSTGMIAEANIDINDKDIEVDPHIIHVADTPETLDQQAQATTPSCGKHQELSEVYDALEREAKRDDWLVDRSFKQDLADARRHLRQGNVDMFPGVGEILADWSSVVDKIQDDSSSELCDMVRREIQQLRKALGQAQKVGKVKS